MGDRKARTTPSIEDDDLVTLTRRSIIDETDDEDDDDDPFTDWAEAQANIASGSQPQALPTSARTATLADPLTTGLLAEVARRAATLEVDPETMELAQRNTQEITPDVLAEALRNAHRTPVPTRHQPLPNVIRKRTTTTKK